MTIIVKSNAIFAPMNIEPIKSPTVTLLGEAKQAVGDQFDGAEDLIVPQACMSEAMVGVHELLDMDTGDLVRLYRDSSKERLEKILDKVVSFISDRAGELSDEQINKLFKSFLCFGWVCRILREPEHSDLSYQQFNDLCRSLPSNCAEALGWQVTLKDPFVEGKSFAALGFNVSLQRQDNLCTLHSVNAVLKSGQEYCVDEVRTIAETLAAKNNREVAYYFSLSTGLSTELRDVLLEGRGMQVLPPKDGLSGAMLAQHLDDLGVDICLIESYAVATQFPNGMISRAPHSALIRQDHHKEWWLVNSMEPCATRVNFSLIRSGDFLATPIKKQPGE